MAELEHVLRAIISTLAFCSVDDALPKHQNKLCYIKKKKKKNLISRFQLSVSPSSFNSPHPVTTTAALSGISRNLGGRHAGLRLSVNHIKKRGTTQIKLATF